MAIVQCINHHYYDDTKNKECPYCAKMLTSEASQEMGEQLTCYMDDYSVDDAQMTEAYGDFVDEEDKTIGFFDEEVGNVLTVGWLVCTCGPQKGKSYIVHSGRNFAGRSLDMDIVLSDDQAISREKHFSIVYDPKDVKFYFVAGEGQTYVNDEPIQEECLLNEGDVLKVGECSYLFIPFCKEGRVWE